MMQPAPMAPPQMDQQQQYQVGPPPPQQQWPQMMAPPQYQQQPQQYQQQPPPAMWNQQPSQIPPPQPPQMQPQQQQMAAMAQYHQVQAPQAQQGSSGELKTLWVGDLQYWMDENYLNGCFAQTGELLSSKVIRNKQSGQSEGYGFVEFGTHAAAEQVLQTYNGQAMPNVEQPFRLNWAAAGERRGDDGPDYTLFVGDLAPDVTDYLLQETFKSHYTSVKGAKIVTDRATGRSKGYGFIRFGDENEQIRAMSEMNGVFCSSRQMRVGPATTKKSMGTQQNPTRAPYQSQSTQGNDSENDPNNTTIFVGGLDPNVTDDLLRQAFSPYGELLHVKIPPGKRCGFVQFANRASAGEALNQLNGTMLGGQSIRLSWGRSPHKQPQQDQNQWNNNYYGGYQGYDGAAAYGYQQPQDPNMYAYAAYQGYQQQQQPQ